MVVVFYIQDLFIYTTIIDSLYQNKILNNFHYLQIIHIMVQKFELFSIIIHCLI